MVRRIFEAQEAAARFMLFVNACRRDVLSELPRATATLPVDAPAREVFQALQSALGPEVANGARLGFAFDPLMPLAERHLTTGFDEALVRLTDATGKEIPPRDLFTALAQAPSLDAKFRAYLPAAQIAAFRDAGYRNALSFNVGANDVATSIGRAALQQTIALATAAGHGPLVIEATEDAPWDASSIAFLAELANRHDVRIALDDVGAGHNDADTVTAFAEALPYQLFMIKLDGHRLQEFLAGRDEPLGRLMQTLRTSVPAAPIIAEWISTPEEARACLDRMEATGLSNAFAFAQSGRHSISAPDKFLAAMNAKPALAM